MSTTSRGNAVLELQADARQGSMKQISLTLGSGGTVTVVTLPSGALGYRITAGSAIILHAVDEDPAVLATSSGQAVAAAALGVGNSVPASGIETRILAATAATLHLQSATASATLLLEVW
jgi:hypothetical protein